MNHDNPFAPPTGQPVAHLPPPNPGELPRGSGDPIAFVESLPPTTRLIDLAPSLLERTGPIDERLIPTRCKSAVMNNAPTWEQLGQAQIKEMLAWANVGIRRVANIVTFVRDLDTHVQPVLRSDNAELVPHLQLLAAWAIVTGSSRGLQSAIDAAYRSDTPPEVALALAAVNEVALDEIASQDLITRFDPIASARDLLAEFEGRDREVLERLLARGLRHVPTLEEIGTSWGVTRERVRQKEVGCRDRLARLLESARFAVVRRHADTLGETFGAVLHTSELPPEMTPSASNDLVDELFLWLVGPYAVDGDYLLRNDAARSVADLLRAAYETAADGYAAPVDAVLDALESSGASRATAQRIIDQTHGWNVFGDHLIRWTNLRDRVLGVLQVTGRPMPLDELTEAALDTAAEVTLRGLLSAAPELRRVRADWWGLSTWEGEQYSSILTHMEEELLDGPMPLSSLTERLDARFGISRTSVTMYAQMHPRFVFGAGVVRLRGEDEPYIPTSSLELTAGCYVIDGAWSAAIVVDHDLLRGSGRHIPEAFAVHLGLQPGAKGEIECEDRRIKLGWGMRPTCGSLRWIAEREGLTHGDLLFLRRATPSSIEFRWTRRTDLASESPRQRLLSRLGASHSVLSVERITADALGLGGASEPAIAQLRARLIARDETAIADLLAEAASLREDPATSLLSRDDIRRIHLAGSSSLRASEETR